MLLAALTGCGEASTGGGIDVIDVSGPLDARALSFMSGSIRDSADNGQVLALLQIDSPAVLDGEEYDRLIALLESPPLPVATWVGPAPAVAYGGAVIVAETAEHRAVAPGSTWGLVNPVVLGGDHQVIDGPDEELSGDEWPGMAQEPALRQYLQSLDGKVFQTADGPVTMSTLTRAGDEVTLRPVTFHKPGLVDRFFRLAVLPETAFFFLVVGLTIVTFEFYALGPGVAAFFGAVSLLLGGWGMTVLPSRWWAVGLVVLGWILLTWVHQRGGSTLGRVAGSISMFLGGVFLIDGAGQIDPRWWLVLPSVLAVLFFYLLAMPTVQRARLSTMTVGRENLVGMAGRATVDFDPDGVVEVAGARWRATAHREAGLRAGAEVVVTGVDGLFLEVEGRET
jgi:membrane-bound serine protease (ClpP class)